MNWPFLLIAFALIVIAFWFISKNYRHFYKGYKVDWRDRRFILRLLLIFVKTLVSLFVIVMIHNLYHEELYFSMLFLAVGYVFVSIIQSEYARVGFQSRFKYIINYIGRIFSNKKKQALKLFKGLNNDEFDRYLTIVKVLLLVILYIIFLSQIGFFILGNLYYVLVVSSLFLLTFILNNLIYFGFTSLVLLQFVPEAMTLSNVNYHILVIAFIIIFIGMLFDNIFNERICVIKGNYYIKHIKFDNHYQVIRWTSKIVIYQHKISRIYYIHYRSVGFVIAFESYYDAKTYKSILKKMIVTGKRFLVKNKESLKSWL